MRINIPAAVSAWANKSVFCIASVDFLLCIAHKSEADMESMNIDIAEGTGSGKAATSTHTPTPSMKPAHNAERAM